MASRWKKYFEAHTMRHDVDRLRDLVVRYVKEETVDPVKDLGRYAGFGCLGSIFIGLGTLLGLIGVLRLLQTETGAFHGNLSWLPYLIVIALALVVMALVGWRIVAGPAKRRLPKSDKEEQ